MGAAIAFLLFPDTDWKIADSRLTDETPPCRPALRPALDRRWLARHAVRIAEHPQGKACAAPGCQAPAGDANYHPVHAGLAKEMKQKGAVVVVNGKASNPLSRSCARK